MRAIGPIAGPILKGWQGVADVMTIEILADGTIKTTTDPISGANHQSAEQFLNGITSLTGGPVQRQKRGNRHTHTHATQHETQGNK